MALKIVTDGTADMPDDWRDEFGIEVLPFKLRFGDLTFTQGKDIDRAGFYRMVHETRTIPKTTMLTPHEIEVFYKQVASPGDEILSIHVSRKMSGTFESVQTAAKQIAPAYTVYPFDSTSGSAAIGFMCREARKLDTEGATISQILNRLEEMRKQIFVALTLDTLEFAYLNGRINAFQSAISSLLSVKPIVVLNDGLLQMGERIRTRKKALESILQMVSKRFDRCLLNVAIVHAEDIQTATTLAEQMRGLLNCQEIIIVDLSISVAANLGPCTVGIVAYPV